MMIFNPSITHLSFLALIKRFFRVLLRYGLSTRKIQSNLNLYLATMKKYKVTPTFPITATLVCRYPEIIKNMAENGVNFAVHGYEHVDYTRLSHKKSWQHLEKANQIFREHNISFLGFRFPYLRCNHKSINQLRKGFFKWDSSCPILWNVMEKERYKKEKWLKYQNMLNRYDYKSSYHHLSIPKFSDGLLEIPVSLPDDDLLIDRLGIKEQKILYKIWSSLLKQTHSRGELAVFQLHPERFHIYRMAIEKILKIASEAEPKIWVASLDSIYEWWKEKQNFRIILSKRGSSEYEIHANCSERAMVLKKSDNNKNHGFYNGYKMADSNTFLIKSRKKPIIGVSETSTPALTRFLKNEGFIFETNSSDDNYSIFLNGFEHFNEKDGIQVLQKIEKTNSSLIRFWRWPNGYKSALSITGDIDAITSADFFLRFFP